MSETTEVTEEREQFPDKEIFRMGTEKYKICETCKWWERYNPKAWHGYCLKMPKRSFPVYKNFGCINWEEKE